MSDRGDRPNERQIAEKQERIAAQAAFELLDCRAGNLLKKGKPFVVVACDEPYFWGVYNTIRAVEKSVGTWSDEDQRLYLNTAHDAAKCTRISQAQHAKRRDSELPYHYLKADAVTLRMYFKADAFTLRAALADAEAELARASQEAVEARAEATRLEVERERIKAEAERLRPLEEAVLNDAAPSDARANLLEIAAQLETRGLPQLGEYVSGIAAALDASAEGA